MEDAHQPPLPQALPSCLPQFPLLEGSLPGLPSPACPVPSTAHPWSPSGSEATPGSGEQWGPGVCSLARAVVGSVQMSWGHLLGTPAPPFSPHFLGNSEGDLRASSLPAPRLPERRAGAHPAPSQGWGLTGVRDPIPATFWASEQPEAGPLGWARAQQPAVPGPWVACAHRVRGQRCGSCWVCGGGTDSQCRFVPPWEALPVWASGRSHDKWPLTWSVPRRGGGVPALL